MASLTTPSLYLTLTAITIAAVSSGLREQVLGMTSSEICQNHTVLNEHWREIGSERGDHCDSHIREGWYRLMTTDGHSSSLPTTCIKNHVCGLVVAMWLDLQGEDLPQPGSTVRGFVCGSYPVLGVWQCCVVRETAYIHNCGDHYLYRLRPTDRCSVGYCGEGPRSDISPHTVKTGEPAPDSSDRFRRRLRPQTSDVPASDDHLDIDMRSIRDVSTPDDLPCPEGHTRCPNSACVASHHLCSSEESTSASTPTTDHVTRTPITFYFSVLRDRTRSPLSFTSGQPVLSAHTSMEDTNLARQDSSSLSSEEGTKRLVLDGETTLSVITEMPATTVELTNREDLSTISSDTFRSGSSLLIYLSGGSERPLSTVTVGSSDSDHASNTTAASYSEKQRSMLTTAYFTNQQRSTTTSLTNMASKSTATFTTNAMVDATSVTDSNGGKLDTIDHFGLDLMSALPSKTIDDTWKQHASLHVGSCSACLQPSVASLPLMSVVTNALPVITSLDLATQDIISTHATRSEHMASTVLTISSSTVIPHAVVSFTLQPTAAGIISHSLFSTVSHAPSPTTSMHAPVSTYSQNVPSYSASQSAPFSTVSQSAPFFSASVNASFSTVSQNAPVSTASQHAFSSSAASQITPSFSVSHHAPSSTTNTQPLVISSVSPRTSSSDISPSVTLDVIPSKMATVRTSPSAITPDDPCTQCIEVVFNLRDAITDKQAERDFHASVQTAFSRVLTRFHGRRFYRDVGNATHHKNSTLFLPTDIYIRNSTSSGNIMVLWLEAKNPLGDFVHDQYLAFLLQKSEVRQSLEQDLSAYGATLAEFSVPVGPSTETPRPEAGVTSIFARHFGLFLAVIVLSSFVAFAGLVAMVYIRNRARTGMWYCPSGTRYAKQLERTLLTKTTNWRVGQMTSPIPDVDILSGEGLMTENTREQDGSRRASYMEERASGRGSYPEVDTWVVPLGEAMDDRLADKEYDTRL